MSSSEAIIRRGLEELLERLSSEIAEVEARLEAMARRFGVETWRELEDLFEAQGLDSPALDQAWPEYVYLRDRLEKLREEKRRVLELVGRRG